MATGSSHASHTHTHTHTPLPHTQMLIICEFILYFKTQKYAVFDLPTVCVFNTIGSAMFGATYNLVTRVGLPLFLEHSKMVVWKSIISIKGAFDKYNIYLFTYYFIGDFELNQYQNVTYNSASAFILWGILWTASFSERPGLLYCAVGPIYWSRLWRIENARNIHISSTKLSQSRTLNSACSHYPCQQF